MAFHGTDSDPVCAAPIVPLRSCSGVSLPDVQPLNTRSPRASGPVTNARRVLHGFMQTPLRLSDRVLRQGHPFSIMILGFQASANLRTEVRSSAEELAQLGQSRGVGRAVCRRDGGARAVVWHA